LLTNVNPVNDLSEACIRGKQTRLRFEMVKNKDHINRPLFVVHSDVWSDNTSNINKKNYYVVFIDQYTHYRETYL